MKAARHADQLHAGTCARQDGSAQVRVGGIACREVWRWRHGRAALKVCHALPGRFFLGPIRMWLSPVGLVVVLLHVFRSCPAAELFHEGARASSNDRQR